MTSLTDPLSIPFPGFEVVELFSPDYSGENPLPMLVENLMPEGAPGMLIGEPRVSKTQIALTLSIGVAAGTPVLGQDVPAARPVLYIANEGSRRELGTRVERIRIAMGVEDVEGEKLLEKNLHILIPSIEPSTFEPVSPSTIYALVSSTAKESDMSGLLVIDTLAPLIIGEENSAESARGLWAMANSISNAFGWTVLFIHHKRKTYGKRGASVSGGDLSEIRGSSAHGASARFILGVTQVKTASGKKPATGWSPFPSLGDILELKMLKRNDGPEGFTLRLSRDPETGLLRDIPAEAECVCAEGNQDGHARTKVETKEVRVLKIYLDQEMPESIKKERALKVFTGVRDPEAALRSTLRRLRTKGMLEPYQS